MILAIDPGPKQSAYAVLGEQLRPVQFGIMENERLVECISDDRFKSSISYDIDCFAVEMVASYGMSVGADVFETVFWIGRLWQAAYESLDAYRDMQRIYRKDVKMNLCGSMRAKDSNIRQALIDRFGPVGTKKKPGWFYGVKKDIWAAVAVGVTYADQLKINREVG